MRINPANTSAIDVVVPDELSELKMKWGGMAFSYRILL